MKITKQTDLQTVFVPEAFYSLFHPDRKDMLYVNRLPTHLVFLADKEEDKYLIDRIRTVGTDDYLKFKEYFDSIGLKPHDWGADTYSFSGKFQRKEGVWDAPFWLLSQQKYNEPGKQALEIDFEWYVRKRRFWSIPIPGTLRSFFRVGVILPDRMIGEDIRISKEIFEENEGIFTFCLSIYNRCLAFDINNKDGDKTIECFVIRDIKIAELANSVKFDLFINSGVSKLPKKDKSHSMEVWDIEVPDMNM